jgi:hypothetical protein
LDGPAFSHETRELPVTGRAARRLWMPVQADIRTVAFVGKATSHEVHKLLNFNSFHAGTGLAMGRTTN